MNAENIFAFTEPASHTPGPYVIGQPGGPAGLFWSIVNSQGTLVAMQITSKKNAEAIVAGLNLLNAHPNGNLILDALAQLKQFREAAIDLYAALNSRQHCDTCNGSGLNWTLVGEEAEPDPCDCWMDAERMLEQYLALFGVQSEQSGEKEGGA